MAAHRFVQLECAKRRRGVEDNKMSDNEYLYGITRLGTVWKYDADRELWESLSMSFSPTARRHGLEHHQRG